MTRLLVAFFIALALALPAVAAEPPAKPFNGVELSGWKFKGDAAKSKWKVGVAGVDQDDAKKLVALSGAVDGVAADMINFGTGVDIYTEAKYGDCVIEIEVMVPKGSNSGIYVMGEYEVQVLDSYGKDKIGPGDMGGLYSAAAPKVNAAKKPGEWQKFVIEFQAPRFEGDKKVKNATFVKVTLNDQVIHENVEIKAPTPSCLTNKESPTGPIMFQGDHGPVAYRNIVIKPLKP